MPHAAINGFQMHYETYGDAGEPLVLVHGYTGDISDWDEQIPLFSKTHRVLAMDHRGHGGSEAPKDRSSYTIVQMADDVEALIAQTGIERYHLVGHSMGGGVAQEIALRSGARLLSLTLFGTAPDFNFGRVEAVRTYMENRMRIAEEQGMAALASAPSTVPDPPHVPAARKAAEAKRMAAMSVDGFIGGWNALTTWEGTKERAHAITAPSLLLAGELEPAVKSMQWLHGKIAGSELIIVPESGHSPQWERPEVFNAALGRHVGAG
jgi:3-oxoadipate enol-lactonase/4-carboxymuconolactone decarboxylase